MAATRESAFLPTIKCSQCGAQVEISMMGEHICSGPSAECEYRYLVLLVQPGALILTESGSVTTVRS